MTTLTNCSCQRRSGGTPSSVRNTVAVEASASGTGIDVGDPLQPAEGLVRPAPAGADPVRAQPGDADHHLGPGQLGHVDLRRPGGCRRVPVGGVRPGGLELQHRQQAPGGAGGGTGSRTWMMLASDGTPSSLIRNIR